MSKKPEYINLDYLQSMTGDAPDIIKEMIDIFIAQVPELHAEMTEMYNKSDWTTLGMIAHKAKSSVSIMGMESLAGDLKQLEMLARESKDVHLYKAYIEKFKEVCDAAVDELKVIAAKF